MKKLIITALALCLLCGCGTKSELPVTEPESPSPAVQEQEVVPEETPVEMETEIVEGPSPEEIPSEEIPLEWNDATTVEGLIEDTIAYSMVVPVFSGTDGAEMINSFYVDLVDQLVTHTKETVYAAVLDKHTGANVSGIVDSVSYNAEWAEITYEYRVEYLDGSDPDSFTRTDCFDLTTGELLSEE